MASLSCFPKFEKKVIVDVWKGETLKLMLLSKLHTPNAGTQQFVSDVVAYEILDEKNIYTAGGVALQNKVTTPDPANGNNYFLDADDVKIGPGTTIEYRYGIIYKDLGTGNHSVNTIKAHIDFLTDQIVTNGVSTIRWSALGIIYVS